MTDITGISGAFAAQFGFNASFWGYILGTAVLVALVFIFNWGLEEDTSNTFIAAIIGLVLDTAIGWYDLWVLLAIFVLVVFVWVDPFHFRSSAGGA